MSYRSFAAVVLIALAATACSNSPEPTYGPTVATAPNDPVVSFADRECTNGTATGHGMGCQRCIQYMDQVAQANGGAPYFATLRSD